MWIFFNLSMLIPSSWSCTRALKDAATLFGSHGGGSKNCLPITDFKERGGQSQRRKTGFLWIKEAGIPLLGESSSNGAGLGFFESFTGFLHSQRSLRGLSLRQEARSTDNRNSWIFAGSVEKLECIRRFQCTQDHRPGGITLQKYFLIAFGGALGSVARYWVGSTIANRMGMKFPYGTFVINITACAIIGFTLTFLGRRADLNPAWRFLVPVGFIGAYSTFSTYEWETLSTLRSGAFFLAALYAIGSLIVGLAAVWGGSLLAEMI